MARRDPIVARALVDVCTQRSPDLPNDPAIVDDFVDAVRLHRIAPLAHVLLRDARPDLAARLDPDRAAAKAIHLRASLVLDELGRVLDDLPWVAFKGPVLSELAHPVPGLRSYGDVDVLVDPRDLRTISRRLEAAGWTAGDDLVHHYTAGTPGEMHWRSPAGLLVDLHWSMINRARVRDRHDVSTGALLSRRHVVALGLTRAPVLDPVDALVHVCLHAGLSGGHRLLWLLDVDQLARRVDDWPAMVARARAWDAAAPIAVALARARTFLGVPVPDTVLAGLGVTTGMRRILVATDRVSPVPSLVREESLAKLVGRAARRTAPRTLAQVTRSLGLGVWHRRPTVRETGAEAERVPVDDRAREHYLQAVEAVVAGEPRT